MKRISRRIFTEGFKREAIKEGVGVAIAIYPHALSRRSV
jgi:hypothetical protein